MRRHLEALRWPFAAVVGAVAPLVWALLSGHTLVWRDSAQLYAPHRVAVSEALRSLRLPQWNPWEGTGQPLLAQGLDSVLHPVSLAMALLTPSTDALIVALILLATLGAWTAARTLEASPAAAAGAALAFALSGYTLAMSANVLYLVGAASGPWAVAGLNAAARRRGGWVAAAAGVALLALSGDAGSLAAFAAVGMALAWAAGGQWGPARAALGAALGLALAAPQLLPSWLYLDQTWRRAGLLDPGSVHRWALAPWRLVELVAPGFFVGVPRSYLAPVFEALGGESSTRFPFASSVFVGAPVIALAVAGARRSAPARWLLALGALLAWLALGHRAGSQQLLSWVPVWGALRYWEKMVGPLTLVLALTAARGIDAVRDGRERWLAPAAAAGAALSLALAAALAVASPGAVLGVDGATAEVARARLSVGFLHAAAALASLVGVLAVGRRWPRVLPAALVAVVFAGSVAASPFALHLGDPVVLAVRPPALAAAPPGPRTVAPLGFDFVRGEGGLDAVDRLQAWEARSARPSTNVVARLDSLAAYSGLTSTRWEMVLGSGPLFWPLARRFGTTHVLARQPASAPEVVAIRAATLDAAPSPLDGGRLLMWEVPHRDWASFAPAVRAAPDLEAAGAMLGEEMLAGRPTVVVEAPAAPAASPGRVLSVLRGAEEVAIEAESPGDAVLVVNDAWAPGWRASIDGRGAEVLPADVLVRAVPWPAGRHRLVMRYRTPGLAAGLAISGLALATAVVFAWLRWRRPLGPPAP